MKIKGDFVTNSSSSSFIFFLDKKPETAEELKEVLFGDLDEVEDGWREDLKHKTIDLARSIFEDIKDQTGRNIPSLYDELRSLVYINYSDYIDFDAPDEVREEGIKRLHTEEEKLTKLKVKEVLSYRPDKWFFVVSADDSGGHENELRDALNESNLVDHIIISHH